MNVKLGKMSRGLVQIPLLIGLLIMAVAVPVATKLVQENQTNQGKAATCGGENQICCNNSTCNAGLNCILTNYGKYCTKAIVPTNTPTKAPNPTATPATKSCTVKKCSGSTCSSSTTTVSSSQACPSSNCTSNSDCAPAATNTPTPVIVKKYSCDSTTGTCSQNSSGAYSDSASCSANCKKVVHYACNSVTGLCSESSSGAYTDLNQCSNNCKLPTATPIPCGSSGQNCCFSEYVGGVTINNKCNSGLYCNNGKCGSTPQATVTPQATSTPVSSGGTGEQCKAAGGWCLNGGSTGQMTCNTGNQSTMDCPSNTVAGGGKVQGCCLPAVVKACTTGGCSTLGATEKCTYSPYSGVTAEGTRTCNKNAILNCYAWSECKTGTLSGCLWVGNAMKSGESKCFNSTTSISGIFGSDYVTCKSDGTTSNVHYEGSDCKALSACSTNGCATQGQTSTCSYAPYPGVTATGTHTCNKNIVSNCLNWSECKAGVAPPLPSPTACSTNGCSTLNSTGTCTYSPSAGVNATGSHTCNLNSFSNCLNWSECKAGTTTITQPPSGSTCCKDNVACNSITSSCCDTTKTPIWSPYGYYCAPKAQIPTGSKCTAGTWKCEPINANGSNYQIPCTSTGVWDYGAASRCTDICNGNKCASIGCTPGDYRCREVNGQMSAEVCNANKVWAGTACEFGCYGGVCKQANETWYGCNAVTGKCEIDKNGGYTSQGQCDANCSVGKCPVCKLGQTASCNIGVAGQSGSQACVSGNSSVTLSTDPSCGTWGACVSGGVTPAVSGAPTNPPGSGGTTVSPTSGSTNPGGGKCTQCAGKPGAKLKGDADCTGDTSINDYQIWIDEFKAGSYGQTNKNSWRADFDCTGVVDINDYQIWIDNFKKVN